MRHNWGHQVYITMKHEKCKDNSHLLSGLIVAACTVKSGEQMHVHSTGQRAEACSTSQLALLAVSPSPLFVELA